MGAEGPVYVADFGGGALGCEVGQEVFVYYKRDREFMQQPVCIEAVSASEEEEKAVVHPPK